MTDTIKHQGIVENIDGAHLQVRIVQTSACAACSIKGHCSSADSKEKLIDVNDPASAQICRPGDRVWVMGQLSMGYMAVLLAFVVPIAMSLHFSTNATLMLYRLSSLATIAPLTPAPIIATSYDIFLPPDGNSMAGFTDIVIIPLFLPADKYIKRHNIYFCRYICSQFMTI